MDFTYSRAGIRSVRGDSLPSFLVLHAISGLNATVTSDVTPLTHRSLVVVDRLRTLLARLIAHHLHRPLPLVIRAWLWLAAETDDIEEKRRCLNAVLQLDPENEPATLALLVLDQRRPTN
jgi:hypothetical protein